MVTVRTDSYRINFGIQKDLYPHLHPTIDARTHARAIYTLVIHRATFLFAAFYPLAHIYKNIHTSTNPQSTHKVLFL